MKERVRVARACDRCKSKKIKCDGTKPCLQCAKSLTDCTFNSSVVPSPEELSARTGVLGRVRKLESQLMHDRDGVMKKARTNDSRFISWYNESYAAARLAETPAAMSNKYRYGRRYTTLMPSIFACALLKNIPASVRAANEISVPRLQGYGWNMSGIHYLPLVPPVVHLPLTSSLLPDELAHDLLQYYFDNINPLFAILHKSMFMTQFKSYLGQKDRNDQMLFTAMLYVTCAIAMRYSEINNHRVYESGLEENLFIVGQRIFEAFSFQWESIELVQGWLLVTFYLRTAHRQSSVWSAIGQAATLAKGMGLMKHGWFEQLSSKYDVLKVNHVFWSLFTMEHFLCVDFGRVFFLDYADVTLGIPENFEDDGWWTPFSFALCKLAIALDQLKKDFSVGLDEDELLEAHLSLLQWNEQTARPNKLMDENVTGPHAALVAHVRLQYNDCLLYIHSRALYPLIDSTQLASLPSSWNIIMMCVRSSISVNTRLRDQGQLCTCWWLRLTSLFNSALLLMVMLNGGILIPEIQGPLRAAFGMIEQLVADGRFKMSDECLWALQMLNKTMKLRMQDTLSFLHSLDTQTSPQGVDVNRRNFGSMGIFDDSGKVVDPHSHTKIHGPVNLKGTNSDLNTVLNNSIDWFNSWEWDPEAAVASFLQC